MEFYSASIPSTISRCRHVNREMKRYKFVVESVTRNKYFLVLVLHITVIIVKALNGILFGFDPKYDLEI